VIRLVTMSDRTQKKSPPGADVATSHWQLQEAKAKFSELVDRAVADGPQIVTRRGEETVVVVSVREWQELAARARPTLKDWLLAPHARTDELVPPRRKYRLRPPPTFDD
jgi:antitoxin Phd